VIEPGIRDTRAYMPPSSAHGIIRHKTRSFDFADYRLRRRQQLLATSTSSASSPHTCVHCDHYSASGNTAHITTLTLIVN